MDSCVCFQNRCLFWHNYDTTSNWNQTQQVCCYPWHTARITLSLDTRRQQYRVILSCSAECFAIWIFFSFLGLQERKLRRFSYYSGIKPCLFLWTMPMQKFPGISYYDNVHNVNDNVAHVFPLFPGRSWKVRSQICWILLHLWTWCRTLNDSQTGDKRCLLFRKRTMILLPACFCGLAYLRIVGRVLYNLKVLQETSEHLSSLPISENADKEFITIVTQSTISLILPLINGWAWLKNSKYGKTAIQPFWNRHFWKKNSFVRYNAVITKPVYFAFNANFTD